ncbi:MAG: hypothetical protein J6D11_05985 [Clostridia bacterium]|nr:hypothetical protein [Clostridia bacterium]
MKKLTALFIAIMTFIFTLTSCGADKLDIPEGMQLVENEKNTYSFFVPEDWSVDVQEESGVSAAYASDKSNVSLMIFDWDGTAGSLQEYCDNYFTTVTTTFKEVSDREMYSDNQYFGTIGGNGEPVLKYVYTIVSDNAATEEVETYKIMQVFAYYSENIVDGGNIYIFTYTARTELYDSHLEEVYDIINEFIA